MKIGRWVEMGILPREASPADQGVRFLIVNGSQALSNKVPEANVILTKAPAGQGRNMVMNPSSGSFSCSIARWLCVRNGEQAVRFYKAAPLVNVHDARALSVSYKSKEMQE